MQPVLFPDAEALVIAHLKAVVPSTHIGTKIPTTRPARLVKVTRVGGSQIRVNAESPMLLFECWDESDVKASELVRMVHAYIYAMAGESFADQWVYKVREVGGIAFSPDPNTNYPRYQFTVSIDVRGKAL